MINILTFSICVLFQTSSKKVGETFTISEENWIIKNYFLQKAYEKTKTN